MHNNKSQKSKVKSQKFLEKIVQLKKADLIEEKRKVPLSTVLNSFPVTLNEVKGITKSYSSPSAQNDKRENQNDSMFYQAILKPKYRKVALIAEVKFASPTNPNLGSADDLLGRVKEYEKSGANTISIITEKHFFKGSLGFVTRVKEVVNIPVLQKDFVIDEYQIYQAKSIGSDAILLIARLVDTETLKRFVEIALEIGIEPVVEINNEEDLKKAIATETSIIAVNARDLDTFEISVDKACNLLKKISEKYIKLGFSGINSKEEVSKYIESGVSGILVGTALMKAVNITEFMGGLR